MRISTVARGYFIEIGVRKFTPKTIRSYRNSLNLCVRYLDEVAIAHAAESHAMLIHA